MGRKKFYNGIEAMQKDLDAYLVRYNPALQHPPVYAIEEKRFC